MTCIEHRDDNCATGGGYLVPRPRRTDALGRTLGRAFGNPASLPEELRRWIAALDQIERTPSAVSGPG